MGKHIAWTQPRDHLLIARRRMIDMAHQGHTDLVSNLERNLKRHDSRGPRGVTADPHLDADDEVAIGVGHLDRTDRVHQAKLLAVSDHDAIGEPKTPACETCR